MLDPLHASEALRYKVDHQAKPGAKCISINYFLLISPFFILGKPHAMMDLLFPFLIMGIGTFIGNYHLIIKNKETLKCLSNNLADKYFQLLKLEENWCQAKHKQTSLAQ